MRTLLSLTLLHASAALANPNQPAPPAGLGAALQSLAGLVAVLAVIAACAWLARRLLPGLARAPSQCLRTVAALPVGQRESVVVVEIAGQWLVLGVAPGRVQALAQLPSQARAIAPTAEVKLGFADVLKRWRHAA